jgi:hypothetical protein
VTTSTTIYISVLAVPLYCEVLISLFYSVKRSINLTNTANLILSLTNLFNYLLFWLVILKDLTKERQLQQIRFRQNTEHGVTSYNHCSYIIVAFIVAFPPN